MRPCLMFLCLLWFGAFALRAADRYVVPPGTPGGTNEGAFDNWSIAATQIQWAVDVATNTEIVWVSNNTYNLTNQIVITNGITLQSAEGHGWNDTIVNGGYVAGSATTNNRCIVISNSAAFVSGLTFSNGAVYNTQGGGVRIYSGILSNCMVCNNNLFSPTNGNSYNSGAGIFITAGTVTASRISANTLTLLSLAGQSENGAGISTPIYGSGNLLISDCVISNNILSGTKWGQTEGGGVYLYKGRIRSSMLCSNNCTVGFGGGISLYNGIMEGCTSTLNQAGYGSGLNSYGNTTVTNCMISYNFCTQRAGAWLHSSDYRYTSTVYNTTIMGNTNGPQQGQIVEIDSATVNLEMKNCAIVSNTIKNKNLANCAAVSIESTSTNIVLLNSTVGQTSGGMGVYAKGGTIRNCLIAGNSNAHESMRGGGLVVAVSVTNISISGCTIVGNMDTNRSTIGAGLRFENTNSAQVSVSSCIIYTNGIGGTDDVYDACAPTNYNALHYSCVGINAGFTGAGIIVADPKFKDMAGGNYRLNANSPCINTGTNQIWMTNSVDLDGNPRIRYGIVDMGAYEVIYKGSVYKF